MHARWTSSLQDMMISVNSISVTDPGIADHYAVKAKIQLRKPSYPRKEISY